MTQVVDLILSCTPHAAKEARDSIERLAVHVSPEVLDDLRLLVSELVTNSVRHGRLPHDGSISLRASVSSSRVRVEVTDAGVGFEPRPPLGRRERIGGYGLYLVHRLASRWGVDTTGEQTTRVWFEIDRASPGRLAV
jgi:anti-sigma regulatory factor (Ser/Thr protein kinase)